MELRNVIIEVTKGGGDKDKVAQVIKQLTDRTMNPSGKPLIVFGEKLKEGFIRDVTAAGARVARSVQELEKLVKEL